MADNIQVKDASGVDRTLRTTDSATVHTPHHIVDKMPGDPSSGTKLLVGTARDKFRDEFFGFDTVNNWEVVQTGAGMTISIDGVANGARYLNVATGNTTNSETIIRSRDTFSLPVKLAFGLSMSQRIANQEMFVELVGVDDTGAVETDTTYPSTDVNNALNAASLKFDAALATNFKYLVRGHGISHLLSAAAVCSTTAATGVTPNFVPAAIYQINADMEEVVFASQLIDSLAVMPNVYKRTQYLPDTSKKYKLQFRVRNVAVAPASSTNVRLHFVRVLDSTRFTVDMARHMGRNDAADAIPTFIAGGSVAISPSPAVLGSFAHDVAFGAGGLFVQGLVGHNAAVAAVSANLDAVRAMADMNGRSVLKVGGIPQLHDYAGVSLTMIAETTLVAAVALTRHELYDLTIANRDNVAHTVDLRDATRRHGQEDSGRSGRADHPAQLPGRAAPERGQHELDRAAEGRGHDGRRDHRLVVQGPGGLARGRGPEPQGSGRGGSPGKDQPR